MRWRLTSKLTRFVLQTYDKEKQIFVVSLQTRAVANLSQDLGWAMATQLGNEFALHHRMLLEPNGKVVQDLLNLFSNDTFPALTLSILLTYPAFNLEHLISSATEDSLYVSSGKEALKLVDCSSSSSLWPTGPLIVFHPHVVLSPTSLPTFSLVDCALSFFSYTFPPTYPMHIGTVLHNVLQSKLLSEQSRNEVEKQLTLLKSACNESGVSPSDVASLISELRSRYNTTGTTEQEATSSQELPTLEDRLTYELLRVEPTLALQNDDIEFIQALATIKEAHTLAKCLEDTLELLRNRGVNYAAEEHIVSTDLGVQGKIDLFGQRTDEETGRVLKHDVVELKTTSMHGPKREMHFMQVCTYFYSILCEKYADSDALFGCEVVSIKRPPAKQPFQPFGSKHFITRQELIERQPINPLFYFLQLYTILRTTYLLILELAHYFSVESRAMTDMLECTAEATQFIDILRKAEPECSFPHSDYTSFLDLVYQRQFLDSKTLNMVRDEAIASVIAIHKHLTGESSTPLALLSHLHSLRVGTHYYSLFYLKSGSLIVSSAYRMRFLVITEGKASQQVDEAHCIASNIFVKVLKVLSSSSSYNQVFLTESAYDFSEIYLATDSKYTRYWAAYPLLPNWSVAGRAVLTCMSQLSLKESSNKKIIVQMDMKLLEIERSIKWCSLAKLEQAVSGPFYSESILILVLKEDISCLSSQLVDIFSRRGLCTFFDCNWLAPFSKDKLNQVTSRNLDPKKLLESFHTRFASFCKSTTRMVLTSPETLLDFPPLSQYYDTIYAIIDLKALHDQDAKRPDAKPERSLEKIKANLCSAIATLPGCKKIFFVSN